MNCDTVLRTLPLFLYGELSFEEQEAVHEHLAACDACQEALERERRLHAELNAMAAEPSPELLAECRALLAARLQAERARRRAVLPALWDWAARAFPHNYALKPAGALALLVVGFLAGRMYHNQPRPPAGQGPAVAEVRALEPQPSGDVRILMDETRPRVVSGRIQDAATRNLLLQAAQASGDPLLRMDSVVILARSGDSPEVRQVLIHALRQDPNPAVRLKAVEALASFAHRPEVRRALGEALLQDENLGVRTEALNVLRQNLDLGLEGILRQVAARESNEYIRAQSQLMLEAIDSMLETF